MKRYPWLDGLRGLAALFVVVHHAVMEIPGEQLRGVAQATNWLRQGQYGVCAFIVLSGYSLMLPAAQTGTLKGGYFGYLKRRARRILPPYYAALGIFLAMIDLVPSLRYVGLNPRWDLALPAFEPMVILAHLLMVFSFSNDWLYKIDPPMWSVGTEWLIYLIFPLLILVWRRWGHAATLALAFGAAFALSLVMGRTLWSNTCPWYAGPFALGMLAASHGSRWEGRSGLTNAWAQLAGIALLAVLFRPEVLTLVLFGAAVAALLAYRASIAESGDPVPAVLRALESPLAQALGSFSYSIYLVHYPLLSLANNLMIARQIDPNVKLAILVVFVSPLVIGLSFLFHLAFERTFMPGHAKSLKRAEFAATVAPAL
jgi:peptidoglycan/LPS O-acetylase OafA/YrhL